MFSIVLLSVEVEYIPMKTTSRLTDFLARILFHSMLGNSGTCLVLRTQSFVSLKSRAWFWTIFLVSSWLGVRKMSSFDSDVSQGKSDPSGAHFLDGPCVKGDRALGLSGLSSAGASSSSYSDCGPGAYLAPRSAEIRQDSSCWSNMARYVSIVVLSLSGDVF